MNARPTLLASVIAVILLALPLAASAANGDTRNAARTHYREALKHFNLGEYDEALREFTASYRLVDDPAQLFNIGQCEFKLGRPEAAVRSYRAYLHMRPDAPNRADVERRIDEIAHQLDPNAGAPQNARASSRVQPAPSTVFAAAPPAAIPLAAKTALVAERTPPTPPASKSAFGGWKLWAIVGVVVAGGIAIAVATTNRGLTAPDTDLGTHRVF